MLKLSGNLNPTQYQQLGTKDARYDTRDIPLIIAKEQIEEDIIDVSNCYMGVQYRDGGLKAGHIKISKHVNDGIAFWSGNVDVDKITVDNSLPFFYSRSNHNDCIHWQTMNPTCDVIIRSVHLILSAKGSNKKGKIMLSEPKIHDGFRLFENGFVIRDYGRFKNKTPAVNANNLRNSILGSAHCPLDGEELEGSSIRIMGRKPNSPKSFGNIIHMYDDVNLELDKSAKDGTLVRVYKRSWTKQDRLDNWSIVQGAINLQI